MRGRPEIISSERFVNTSSPGELLGTAAVVFPNTYEVGSSNLGFHSIYELFKKCGFLTERIFLGEGEPVSLESERPLGEFDVVAFSIPFEDDFLNIARALFGAGLISRDGTRSSGWPVVIAGGIAASINPEPLSVFFDAVCIGDGDVLVPELAGVISDGIASGLEKQEVLEKLATLDGVYVSSVRQKLPIRRRACGDFECSPATSSFLSPYSHFSDTFLVETGRGCGRTCKFCVSRQLYSPTRQFLERDVEDAMRRGSVVADSVGLVGAAVSDHPRLARILDLAAEMDLKVGVSSLRLERVSDELLEKLLRCRVRSVTVAPEAGSQRLRRIIGKPVDDEEILGAFDTIAGAGIERIKAYFLVGLPWENDEDLEAIPKLAKKLLETCRSHGKTKLALSVGIFVPKPWTPFQWCGMPESSELKRRIAIATAGLRGMLKRDLSVDSPRAAIRQAVLSRGGRGVGRALVRVIADDRSFRSALADEGVDELHTAHAWRDESEGFPWEVVDNGLSKEKLWREFEASRRLSEET